MIGKHAVKFWSSTQKVIALSSGEAEYYSVVRGSAEGIGTKSIAGDMGVHLGIRIKEDSSAAKGIAHRTGLGKVRHIEVNQLWVQEKVRNKEIEVVKVNGTDNIADALTKNLDTKDLMKHVRNCENYIGTGRHKIMPETTHIGDGEEFSYEVFEDDMEEPN